MEKIRILCYGDSNTWGYISGSDHQRYGIGERWTSILENLLGNKYKIIEEGLNSRTLTSNDIRPGKEGKNGYEYLLPCLDTHDPIDLVILMLGTNELKNTYNKTAKEIGEMLEEYFVKTILNRKSQCKDTYPKLLLVTPPIVNEDVEYKKEDNKYKGASKKSKELNNIYKEIATKYNCYFLSNKGLETGVDGVHLTEESHTLLANKLKQEITNIYKCHHK
jgi:lysophospholipase L1-like esterase